MPSLQQLERLAHSLRGATVLTVYWHNDTTDPARRADWRVQLRHRLKHEEEVHAHNHHRSREDLARAIEHLEAWIEQVPSTRMFAGLMAVVTADGVEYAETVPVVLPNQATWEIGVRLAPALLALPRHATAVVAVADTRHVALYAIDRHGLTPLSTMEAERHSSDERHLGPPPRPGFHTGTRGDVATDRAERRRRTACDQLFARAADAIEGLAGRDSWVVLGGTHELTAMLHAHLPERLRARARAASSLDVHSTPAEIRVLADQTLSTLQAEADQMTIAKLLEHDAEGGLATTGAPRVQYALRLGAVSWLALTEQFLLYQPELAEELVRQALATHATIACLTGDAAKKLDRQAGGIGVQLRYTPGTWAAPAGDVASVHA